jgi:hypothetical protein
MYSPGLSWPAHVMVAVEQRQGNPVISWDPAHASACVHARLPAMAVGIAVIVPRRPIVAIRMIVIVPMGTVVTVRTNDHHGW